jgi:hypothetical protein
MKLLAWISLMSVTSLVTLLTPMEAHADLRELPKALGVTPADLQRQSPEAGG